jgi:hypothetical protein
MLSRSLKNEISLAGLPASKKKPADIISGLFFAMVNA